MALTFGKSGGSRIDRAVKTPLVLAIIFGLIHGLVCQRNQGAGVVPMLMTHGDTHAGTDRDHMMRVI